MARVLLDGKEIFTENTGKTVVESKDGMKIYLASPFFNDKEIKRVELMETILRAKGLNVFSPRENQLPELELGSFEWRTNVFRNDIHHIMWADAVVAIIDDNYGDTGTAWEIGYAYAMGKPIYLYNPSGNIINLMLTDSTHGYFESIIDVIDYDFDVAPIKPYMKEVK